MIITNNHKRALGLTSGVVLQPGIPTAVRDWERISQSAVVAAWVKARILSVTAPGGQSRFLPPAQSTDAPPVIDERADLIQKLQAAGVTVDRRWGIERMRKALGEHQA